MSLGKSEGPHRSPRLDLLKQLITHEDCQGLLRFLRGFGQGFHGTVCMYVCMYVRMCVCVYVCVCMCVCVYVCMWTDHIILCIYIYIYMGCLQNVGFRKRSKFAFCLGPAFWQIHSSHVLVFIIQGGLIASAFSLKLFLV